jgi:hypothetical protein
LHDPAAADRQIDGLDAVDQSNFVGPHQAQDAFQQH